MANSSYDVSRGESGYEVSDEYGHTFSRGHATAKDAEAAARRDINERGRTVGEVTRR